MSIISSDQGLKEIWRILYRIKNDIQKSDEGMTQFERLHRRQARADNGGVPEGFAIGPAATAKDNSGSTM
eukprot:6490920-Amphidinium_carterae.4